MMEPKQWLGVAILAILSIALMRLMIVAMGWRDASLGLIFTIVMACIIVLAVTLIKGDI